MALGDTGISVTAVRNESRQGNRNYISGLNTSTMVNPYSFWSPRPLVFNPTTKILEASTDPSPYAIGDFRRYDHGSDTPKLYMSNQEFILTSGGTGPAPVVIYSNYETNLLRAGGASIKRIGMTFFATLSDAKNYVTSGSSRLELYRDNTNLYLTTASEGSSSTRAVRHDIKYAAATTPITIGNNPNNSNAPFLLRVQLDGTASSSGNTITLSQSFTTLLETGLIVEVVSGSGGSGTLQSGTRITSINTSTYTSFTVDKTPTVALSGRTIKVYASVPGHSVQETDLPVSAYVNLPGQNTFDGTTDSRQAFVGRAIDYTTSTQWRYARVDFYNQSVDTFSGVVGCLPVYTSAPGATNSGTLVTVNSTAFMYPGMALEVTSGTGTFPTGSYVTQVNSDTLFTSSQIPSVALSNSAVVTAYPIIPFSVKVAADPQLQILSVRQPTGTNSTNVFAPTNYIVNNTTTGSTTLSFTFKIFHTNYCSTKANTIYTCPSNYGNTVRGPHNGYFCMRYKKPDGTYVLVSGKQNVSYTAGNVIDGLGGDTVSVSFAMPDSRQWTSGAANGGSNIYTFEVDWDGPSSGACVFV